MSEMVENSWSQLLPDEKRVLESALERDSLAGALRRWRPWGLKQINNGANNRGRPYAEALVRAAVRLEDLGLIGIAQLDPPLDLLPATLARRVIRDINSWWRYEPRYAAGDPGDPGPAAGLSTSPLPARDQFYLVDKGLSGFSMEGWTPSTRMEPLSDSDRYVASP